MNQYDQIKSDVDTKLAEYGVKYTVRYLGEATKWGEQTVDHFQVSLADFKTDYYMGLGNRKPINHAPLKPKNRYDANEWEKKYLKPSAPSAADVLYSLLLDAEAANTSFIDWCGELGYNADSIKDRAVYDECCKIGIKLRKIFTREQRETLAELVREL